MRNTKFARALDRARDVVPFGAGAGFFLWRAFTDPTPGKDPMVFVSPLMAAGLALSLVATGVAIVSKSDDPPD